MSSINTNGINTNFPVPGVNNDTNGFRTNFTAIKNNIDTAATELTDLQTKAVVKSALSGTTVNNDMANTLISNALIRSFRASTFNLGNNLSTASDTGSSIKINVSAGDVQEGTITGTTKFEFEKWAPTQTQSNVELVLTVANTAEANSAILQFPIDKFVDDSIKNLENYIGPNANSTYDISIPNNVKKLHYRFSTLDCGNTISVEPVNRNFKLDVNTGAPVVSNVSAAGTILTATNSSTVTGNGTAFLNELVIGRTIVNSSNVVIGTVNSIASNTSLTLTANAAVLVNNASYRRQIPSGSKEDYLGKLSVDNNFLYVCTANYDPLSPNTAIWKRISLNNY